jgi:hypothetical protein
LSFNNCLYDWWLNVEDYILINNDPWFFIDTKLSNNTSLTIHSLPVNTIVTWFKIITPYNWIPITIVSISWIPKVSIVTPLSPPCCINNELFITLITNVWLINEYEVGVTDSMFRSVLLHKILNDWFLLLCSQVLAITTTSIRARCFIPLWCNNRRVYHNPAFLASSRWRLWCHSMLIKILKLNRVTQTFGSSLLQYFLDR